MSTKKPDAKKSQNDAVALIKAAAAKQAAQAQQPQQQQGSQYDFKKNHLHIGIPCYGGMVSEPTMTSLLRFILLANKQD